MASPRRPAPFSPLCGRRGAGASRSPEVDSCRRRAEFGWALHFVGLSAIVAAGFFAIVGFPILLVDLPPQDAGVTVPTVSFDFVPVWAWLVRVAAIGGFVLESLGTFLDQHYSGEVLVREEGEGSRGEFLLSSLAWVAITAAPTLLIVTLYRGA